MRDQHLGQLNATAGADAKLTLFVINAGGKLVRQEFMSTCRGRRAPHLTFAASTCWRAKAHCDVTLSLGHNSCPTQRRPRPCATWCSTGKGQGVFQGQIRVAQIAQKTDAQMACNTLLLSDTANSRPSRNWRSSPTTWCARTARR
jgi:Fe-S cluster assembly protein SufD